ncbi:unnamed protein product [Owenia fusiformis]|uniref:Uncharacterized protein n=1 Tax=Owenia fusiformis TaxID=6347 RepID=A0A8J1U0D7_OWEFU|nr:unnamed protein product [Owenia fusiformis]
MVIKGVLECIVILIICSIIRAEYADYDVRLSGDDGNYGRVEIYLNGTWGRVCNDEWDIEDARVVCKQLGFDQKHSYVPYNRGTPGRNHAQYGKGRGAYVMSKVECTGSEIHLSECKHQIQGEKTSKRCKLKAPHDAIVTCKTIVRLAGKKRTKTSGRLEIYKNSKWRPVCYSSVIGPKIAEKLCATLGIVGVNPITFRGEHFGRARKVKPWWLSLPCEYGKCGIEREVQSCDINKYANIECSNHDRWPKETTRIKLGNKNYGEVNVQVGDDWLPVCNRHWNEGASRVVCKQQRYDPDSGRNSGTSLTGVDNGNVIVTDMTCTGDEENLSGCSFSKWKITHLSKVADECNASSDGVQVSCLGDTIKARLVGGPDEKSGRVEIWYKNEWRKACDSKTSLRYYYWVSSVCKDVNGTLQYGRHHRNRGQFGRSTSQTGVRLRCIGAKDLQSCRIEEMTCAEDTHFDLAVSCFDHEPGLHEYVMPALFGYEPRDKNDFEGGIVRLNKEYWNDGETYTICGDNWSINEAKVVCRQMGYDTTDAAADQFSFLDCYDGDKVVMSDVSCTGEEASLSECSFSQGENITCSDGSRASVYCEKIPLKLTINGQDSNMAGEVTLISSLATAFTPHPICSTGWDDREAKVVCRQLGYPYANASVYMAEYNASNYDGNGPFLTKLGCNGSETHLGQCQFEESFSVHSHGHLYDFLDYCTEYEFFVNMVDHMIEYKDCEGGQIAGVICQ